MKVWVALEWADGVGPGKEGEMRRGFLDMRRVIFCRPPARPLPARACFWRNRPGYAKSQKNRPQLLMILRKQKNVGTDFTHLLFLN